MSKFDEVVEWWVEPETIEREFMHLVNLKELFITSYNERVKATYKTLLDYGWTYQEIVTLETRGQARSNFNSDVYINNLMGHHGCVGEKVGLGWG